MHHSLGTLRSGMRLLITASILVIFIAALSGCTPDRNPVVTRSTIRIEAAARGDLQTSTGLLKDVVYVERPVFSASNADMTLFVADADERTATQVKVHLGDCTGKYAEVQQGLKPGDRVILSDLSQYGQWQRINLR